MKFFKTLTAAIIPVIVLTACSLFSSVLSFDASGYAKACLDATLKQDFTEYAKLTGQTEEEAKAEFEKEDIFGDAADTILSGIDSSVVQEYQPKYKELIKQIYAQCKYEVGEASKNEDGSYSVPITAHKMNNVYSQAIDKAGKDLEKYAAKQTRSLSDRELNEKYVKLLYDRLSKALSNITYDEPQVITVSVRTAETDSRTYEIPSGDFTKIFSALIDI